MGDIPSKAEKSNAHNNTHLTESYRHAHIAQHS